MIVSRPATDPASAETATTDQLRARYLVAGLFTPGEVTGVYTHEDRMVVAGAAPRAGEQLELEAPEALGPGGFLDRRELGVVNLGTPGEVLVDGEAHALGTLDGLYVGRGHRVALRGEGARFYLVSATAHRDAPTAVFRHDEVEPVEVGDAQAASARALRKYVVGGGHPACQLSFGVTDVHPGSAWNTVPPHLHSRRTEVYCYTGLAEGARVVHLLGEPGRTRHLVVGDGEAVISPAWSVHAGAGTSSYSFVWAMAGENTDYTDLSPVPLESL